MIEISSLTKNSYRPGEIRGCLSVPEVALGSLSVHHSSSYSSIGPAKPSSFIVNGCVFL